MRRSSNAIAMCSARAMLAAPVLARLRRPLDRAFPRAFAIFSMPYVASLEAPGLQNGTRQRVRRVVVAPHGRLSVVLLFTISRGKIIEIDVVVDPERLRELDLAILEQ